MFRGGESGVGSIQSVCSQLIVEFIEVSAHVFSFSFKCFSFIRRTI